MQYTLICNKEIYDFEHEVSQHLRRGWKLKGETFTARRSEIKYGIIDVPLQYDVFCQAMIKYDEGEKEE